MIENRLANSSNYKKINDSEMKSAIGDFFRYCWNSDISFSKGNEAVVNKQHTYKTTINALSKLFLNINFSELNAECCKTLSLKATGVVRAYELFWIFLVENGYIADAEMKRLPLFRDVFIHRNCPAPYMAVILEDTAFNLFAESEYNNGILVKNNHAFSTFFFTPNLTNIIDEELSASIKRYFDKLKYITDYTPGSLRGVQLDTDAFVSVLFSGRTLTDITRECISDVLFDSSNKYIYGSNKVLIPLLCHFADEGFDVPDGLADIAMFAKDKPLVTGNLMKRMLLEPHADRWYYIRRIWSDDSKAEFKSPGQRYVYIDHASKEIREIIADFLTEYGHSEKEIDDFCSYFSDSMQPHTVETINDFSYKTYRTQLQYFYDKGITTRIISQTITAFYLYIWRKYNDKLFVNDYVDVKLLLRPDIGRLILQGYEIVNYTPSEPAPESDLWILCYEDMITSNSMVKNGMFNVLVDFTKIRCSLYKQYVKEWFWGYPAELESKTSDLRSITDGFNYIFKLKKGEELSLHTSPSNDLTITINDIVAWKQWVLNTVSNNRSRNHRIYAMRRAITYISDKGLCNFESGVFYHLTFSLNQNYDNSNPINDDDLRKLAKVFKDEANNSTFGKICYAVFYIALETEFRPSQIFALEKNCVVETAKKNEHVVVSRAKTTAGERKEFPITEYTKREIDEIISVTDEYRDCMTTSELNNYLFIVPRRRPGHFQILTPERFNTHMKKCCNIAGIDKYTISNLRDTHMTKAEEEAIRKSLSDVQMKVLTGHANPNSDRTYMRPSIRTMLEATHGAIIGNIALEGTVLTEKTSYMTDENEVSHSCGYCSSKSCDNFTYLDCMLCKNFTTVIDRLPYFEEQVEQINAALSTASIPHDKEDLVNIKRLLLGYIEKILMLKENTANE